MKKVFKIVMLFFVLLLGVFMLLKTIASFQMTRYLEDKYDQEFVVDKKRYDFINGKFYIVVHPKIDPSLSFRTMDGYGDFKYVDYYLEELWVKQVEKDYSPFITKYFPDFKRFNAKTVYGTGMEQVSSGDIPNYKDARPTLSLVIRFDQEADERINEEFYQKVFLLVQKIQKDQSKIELSFLFKSEEEKDGQKPDLPFFTISPVQMKSIKSIEDVMLIFRSIR
ncbi:MAG: hypothetical protein AB2392_15265 [Neobacillus sp.]